MAHLSKNQPDFKCSIAAYYSLLFLSLETPRSHWAPCQHDQSEVQIFLYLKVTSFNYYWLFKLSLILCWLFKTLAFFFDKCILYTVITLTPPLLYPHSLWTSSSQLVPSYFHVVLVVVVFSGLLRISRVASMNMNVELLLKHGQFTSCYATEESNTSTTRSD